MNRLIANTVTCTLIGLLSIPMMAQNPAAKPTLSPSQAVLAAWNDIGRRQVGMAEDFPEDKYDFKAVLVQCSFGDQFLHVAGSNGSANPAIASSAVVNPDGKQWIGTWATAPQPFLPGSLQSFRNQSLRLIVHTSAGGTKVRIKISNTFGEHPLRIGGAHIARRTAEAEINPTSDRTLMFNGHASTTVPARSMLVSDPVELDVPALSDLAISLFLPEAIEATTSHILAMQTSYVSAVGDSTATVKFPVAKTIDSWPFLTGVDVAASPRGVAIVAFGSSLTDGDGTTSDTNGRWPDVLAERLQKAKGSDGKVEIGVLNEGIIGNRLLNDSPVQAAGGRFGAVLGQAGLTRFERDVLSQAGGGWKDGDRGGSAHTEKTSNREGKRKTDLTLTDLLVEGLMAHALRADGCSVRPRDDQSIFGNLADARGTGNEE